MKEQLQKIFAPQSTEGFLCMLGIVILLGGLLYAGYRKFYEKRINQVLTGKKVRILSLEAIMILYFIASVISVLVYMGNVYALPNQQIVEETCNVENGYVDFGNTREGVEKKIRELQKQAKTTFIHQEKKNKDGTISMYAEADGKSYIYAIVYPYTYPLENREFFHISVNNAGIGASFYQERVKSENELIGMIVGHHRKKNCPVVEYDLEIYNFTEGENKHPLDIKQHFRIEKGGIETK